MNLDIGCGLRPMEGKDWETLDKRAEILLFDKSIYKPDIVADVLNGIPRPDNHYDLVRLSSVLEHFSKREKDKVIKECYRVLAHGGKIWISVPDMVKVSSDIINGFKVQENINLTYGEQDYLENTHKWGYTFNSLSSLLLNSGFTEIKSLPAKQYKNELVVEATK